MLALVLTTALASVPTHAVPVAVPYRPSQGLTLVAGDDEDNSKNSNGQDSGSKDTDPPKDQPKTGD